MQRQKQTPPPADEIIIVPDLPIFQQEYSLQPHSVDLDPQKDYRPKSPSTSSQIKLEAPTSPPAVVQEVHPSLRTTTEQRQQLQSATNPLDIQDILGMETLEGYIQTPVQTLDGLVVNQPHRFLPLAEEAKRLAE